MPCQPGQAGILAPQFDVIVMLKEELKSEIYAPSGMATGASDPPASL